MENKLPIFAWPEGDRPRERLFALGSSVLSDAELVAILLGTGGRGRSALDLAHQLLQQYNGIFSLARNSAVRISNMPGIGPAKAARILAACELGRRREGKNNSQRTFIRCPADAARIAAARLRDSDRECFLAILLDTKHKVLSEELVSVGILDQASVHPREIFRPALEYSAAALVLAHNHPSGDPSPSQSDLRLTRQLLKASDILGIRLLDHIIIGDGEFLSLAEKGYFKKGEVKM